MISAVCQHENRRTNGKTKAGATRYRCKSCGVSWTEATNALDGMRIGLDRTEKIISLLSYCFTAIDRGTKLLVAWHMGRRTQVHTEQFIAKLESATFGHFHISSDGWRSYPSEIKNQLGHRVDHGVMHKMYGLTTRQDQRRYSPARIIGAVKTPMHGTMYKEQICTSHVERMNGSIRTFCKRMGRLTYCFSKKWANHRAALAVFFCHYNYCRKHRTLKGLTPAMAHGLTTEVWSVRKLLETVLTN